MDYHDLEGGNLEALLIIDLLSEFVHAYHSRTLVTSDWEVSRNNFLGKGVHDENSVISDKE